MNQVAGHPAPFKVLHDRNTSSELCHVADAQGGEIATCTDCETAKALASMPDLLKACKGAIDELGHDEEFDAPQLRQIIDEAVGVLRAAIAKATGAA